MTEIFTFLQEHWILTTTFLLLLAGACVFEAKFVASTTEISIEKAVDLINHAGAVVLDIRKTEDFAVGHIVNAVNILPQDISVENKRALVKYSKKPVIVTCYRGVSSVKAVNELKQLGIAEVFNLSGGMQAWVAANLPLAKK